MIPSDQDLQKCELIFFFPKELAVNFLKICIDFGVFR